MILDQISEPYNIEDSNYLETEWTPPANDNELRNKVN